jgi:hypothetical protein
MAAVGGNGANSRASPCVLPCNHLEARARLSDAAECPRGRDPSYSWCAPAGQGGRGGQGLREGGQR